MSILPTEHHPLIRTSPVIDTDLEDSLGLSPRDIRSPVRVASEEGIDLDGTFESVPKSFLDSVAAICKEANQVMVYGWDHCMYTLVAGFLMVAADQNPSWPIKKVFDMDAGKPPQFEGGEHVMTTLEGRQINLIDFSEPMLGNQRCGRLCKTALANIVLENYKRKKEGLPLIPILFCIDVVGNEKPFTLEKLTSKNENFNDQITYKELRRAYKLCTHEDPAIRQVAQESFRFVRTGTEGLEPLESPWADADRAATCWKARKSLSQSLPKPPRADWNAQLIRLVAAYDAEHAAEEPESLALAPSNVNDGKENYSAPRLVHLGLSTGDVS